MGFFNSGNDKKKKGDRDPDNDIEDFNSLYEIKALDSLDTSELDDLPVPKKVDVKKEITRSEQIPETCIPVTDVKYPAVDSSEELLDDHHTPESGDQELRSDFKVAIVWNNKGVALSRLGKYAEAIEAYENALLLDPNYSCVWNNKGVVLSRLGKYQEAVEAYDHALLLEPVKSGLGRDQQISNSRISIVAE